MLEITEKDIEYYLFRNGHLDKCDDQGFTYNYNYKNNIHIAFRIRGTYQIIRGDAGVFTSASFNFFVVKYKKFKQIFKRELLTEKYNG